MPICYLGLGSNLRSPQRQLHQAIAKLRKLPRSVMVQCSRLYFSSSYSGQTQPTYCNGVVAIYTQLTPLQLLSYCQAIEKQQQRLRKKHWGPRTLDIDILLYGQQSIHHRHLTIPHPHLLQRDFVLVPLLDIAPQACLPTGDEIKHTTTATSHILKPSTKL